MDDQIDNYETVDRNQIEDIKDIYSEEGECEGPSGSQSLYSFCISLRFIFKF